MAVMTIDTDKALEQLNQAIDKHDKMAYKSGLTKQLENNQIPLWMWDVVMEKSKVTTTEEDNTSNKLSSNTIKDKTEDK